ncbi:hypothetical protein [Umezawaea sp.]|uniref:hypothetical protein n=1 Tax=Umezawaea sp. TaxID=1955258 RepID=UPI002ED0B24D
MAGQSGPNTVSQNETYLGNRLLFQRSGEVEVGLTDAISGDEAKQILKRAALGAVLIGFAFSGLGLIATIGTAAVSRGLDSSSAVGGFFGLMALLLPWIWIALVLFLPTTEVLSDWHLLLDGKAEIADTAYGVVFRSLTVDHHIPATVAPKRVRVGPPVPGVRNLLHIAIGKYFSYVSVYAFGKDLYLGWTLWRRQIPILVVFRWLGSLFGGDPGYSGMIEMEPIKAMRETVHNALRSAIEAAVIGRSIPLVETFGYDIEIEPEGSQPPVHTGPQHTGPQPVVAPQQHTGPQPVLQPPAVTVLRRAEVYSAEDHHPLGTVEPGATFQVVHDSAENGITVRDENGAIALLKDRSAVQWL